jgi:hypothetical protein
MKTQKRQTINGNSNVFSTSESVLAQALPGSLATPKGWYSEIIDSSSSDLETNFNPCNSTFIENHEEYKTLNTTDAPPMIFSSTNEANRIVNEISSSPIFPSTNISSISDEYNNTSTDSHIIEEKHILTKEEQNLIENVENQEKPPIVIHKKLANNTVTYKQHISVRYLQPPTPPPPEPIIIRKKKRIFLKLFLLFY